MKTYAGSALTLLLLLGFAACTPEERQIDPIASVLFLDVLDVHTANLNGKNIDLDGLQKQLEKPAGKRDIMLVYRIADDAPVATHLEVMKMIKEAGVKGIAQISDEDNIDKLDFYRPVLN